MDFSTKDESKDQISSINQSTKHCDNFIENNSNIKTKEIINE